MGLKRVVHIDDDGRKRIVLLPDEASEEEAERGIPVGPPSLEELGLSKDMEVRLNNELFNRGVITQDDALRGRAEIVGALQATLKVDANSILALYLGKDYSNVRREKEEVTASVAVRRQPQPRRRR